MKTGVTLITMGAGNVKVLRKTFESFSGICDEIVYGDMLLFPEDRDVVNSYKKDFNLKIVRRPFNYVYKHGFSQILNDLSSAATNRVAMYLNTSEIIDEDYNCLETIKANPECNTFFFTHRTDPHRWYRVFDRYELKWSGIIHEQLQGDYRPYHKPVFMMADLEKDMDDPLKAKVFNDVKEIIYFQQYNNIVDYPERLGETDRGWVKFATDDYKSMKDRLVGKGKRYQAFINGDLQAYMNDVLLNPEFEKERFESSIRIEFQGDPKFLGK